MKVKIKKLHPDATLPTYAKPGDAGADLTAISINSKQEYIEYDTGIAFEIPEGYFGMVVPRSSVTNKSLILKNSIGIIDAGFRNSVKFRFKIVDNGEHIYNIGDRIGQIIILPYPQIDYEVVEELGSTERGADGFGSSGA